MFIVIKKSQILLFFICIIIVCFSAISFSSGFSFVYNNTPNDFASIYDGDDKIVYLTFDDGPSSKVTPKVLDILKEQNVKANFFLIGKQVNQFPDIVKREFEEGHFLANHGFSHNNALLYKNKENFLKEINDTDLAISNAIGIPNFKCMLFRFPNGSSSPVFYKEKQACIPYLNDISYSYIDWNALNNDSMQKYSNAQLINNLKNSIKGKNVLVVLMHDTGDVNNTYDVLEDSILLLKSQGYSFRTFHDFFRQ